ncbi:uracil-DNA glycosylase [Massilia sp. PAMC28688]|uniref:uracil-DNA glycosylase n=1 Tax=Massilia sp. PAMC28688 TaxID=2861283 RepID=UPI001C625AB4|nr:uracil-DNA glycosylase [Massilia sp. PAMC28688]QYF93613.1 uracil-DNA glycosylase [Massilia sp. PAMC28688]
MTFDRRAAAFLQEMGITPLWTVRADSDGAHAPTEAAPEPLAHDPAAAPTARVHTPLSAPPYANPPQPAAAPAAAHTTESAWGDESEPAPPTDEDIARMDWSQLKHAIASCTRCGHCKPPRRAVHGAGDRAATWVVAAGAVSAADEQARAPLSGDAGKLLDNMLAAVDLTRERGAYVTHLIKCRPVSASGGDRAPTADEAAACRPYLEREVALTGASMVLTLGQIAANALQDKPLQEALAGSRGQVHAFREVKLVATLHPGELLRRGADKALAWADLCLARTHDGRPG